MNEFNQNHVKDTVSKPQTVNEDVLLDCLIYISSQHERIFSHKELTAGLPLKDNRLNPRIFPRAAERAGFDAQIKKLKISRINENRLPAILLLEDNSAILVLSRLTGDRYDCWMPGKPDNQNNPHRQVILNIQQLSHRYSGYLIVLKLLPHFDARLESARQSKQRKWFWRAISQSSHIYRDVLLASFMINVFALASPLFIMNVYDRVVPNQAIVTLWVLVIGIVIVFLFDLLLRGLRGYFIDYAGKRSDIELSSKIYEKVLNVNMASRPQSVGAFSTHLDEFENVRNFITSSTISTFVDLPFIILFLAVVWFVAGNLVMVPLLAIPLILIYALFMQIPIKRAVEKSQLGATQKNAALMESLIGIETVKVLSAESQLQHKLEDVAEYVSDWRIRSRMLSTSVVNFALFVQQMVTVAVVAYGVYLISDQQLSLGGLIAGVILSGRIMAPMGQIANLATHFHQTRNALGLLDRIMSLDTDRSQQRSYINLPEIKGEIEFDHVSFSYPQQRIPALNDVSFHIRPGEHVGIIGRTGSGKSTIQKLIPVLYQPQQGYVRIDGIDAQQITPAELRSQIGYVQQDVMLFYGSLRGNLVFGDPMVSDEKLLNAIEIAGLTEMIKRHPLGLDMPIGERGSGLSGGQRQSVAVARAVLHRPSIMIMDEPTSAMDNRTETQLINNLQEYLKARTLVLVTHKSSMLALVDRIIVVEAGKIIGDGSKADVLSALKSGQLHG